VIAEPKQMEIPKLDVQGKVAPSPPSTPPPDPPLRVTAKKPIQKKPISDEASKQKAYETAQALLQYRLALQQKENQTQSTPRAVKQATDAPKVTTTSPSSTSSSSAKPSKDQLMEELIALENRVLSRLPKNDDAAATTTEPSSQPGTNRPVDDTSPPPPPPSSSSSVEDLTDKERLMAELTGLEEKARQLTADVSNGGSISIKTEATKPTTAKESYDSKTNKEQQNANNEGKIKAFEAIMEAERAKNFYKPGASTNTDDDVAAADTDTATIDATGNGGADSEKTEGPSEVAKESQKEGNTVSPVSKQDEDPLAQKYASIESLEERAYQILKDLGMI